MTQQDRADRQELMDTIFSALVAALEASGKGPSADLTEETVLVGASGTLDSLGLMIFAIDLEQRLKSIYGENIVLADEYEMTRRGSPFHTVGSLIDHVHLLVRR